MHTYHVFRRNPRTRRKDTTHRTHLNYSVYFYETGRERERVASSRYFTARAVSPVWENDTEKKLSKQAHGDGRKKHASHRTWPWQRHILPPSSAQSPIPLHGTLSGLEGRSGGLTVMHACVILYAPIPKSANRFFSRPTRVRQARCTK